LTEAWERASSTAGVTLLEAECVSRIHQFREISAQVEQIAREEIVSRFRQLRENEVFVKRGAGGNQETVTVADRAVELRLTSILAALLPGSVVVGEEAAAADPSLLDAVANEDLVWVVDPLDGTQNFADGVDDFGVMLALLEKGEIVYSMIHLPTRNETYIAERGAGVELNGAQLERSYAMNMPARGTFHVYYAPPEFTRATQATLEQEALSKAPGGSAATEYVDVARGRKDFIQYFRLLPWDHVPGALIVREMGGVVRDLDGRDYRATDREAFTLVAANEPAWVQVSTTIRRAVSSAK
jgi:fructose-1,6-bisphosphatase/inositol monophosphatase family enzyme